jgi:prophage antirepressor-like protein
MNAIVPFSFEGTNIRTIDIGGEPWFVGKDIAEALGYSNPTDAINDHCKGVAKRYPLQTAGGKQDVRVLSESDVLRLIVSSSLPAAERFAERHHGIMSPPDTRPADMSQKPEKANTSDHIADKGDT